MVTAEGVLAESRGKGVTDRADPGLNMADKGSDIGQVMGV
jgi:hypothetical protein